MGKNNNDDYAANAKSAAAPITVKPVKPAERDNVRRYWVGLRPDCPVATCTVGPVSFVKYRYERAHDSEGSWSVTEDGVRRLGSVVNLSDSALATLSEALTRIGVRITRDADGAVVRANVEQIERPAKDQRPARYRHGLEPVAKWVWVVALDDDEALADYVGAEVPEPVYGG